MQALMLPITMLTKQFFWVLPGNFAELPTLIFLGWIIYYFGLKKEPLEKVKINSVVLLFLLIANLVQLLTMVFFQTRIARIPTSATASPGAFHAWLNFTAIELGIILIYYIVFFNIKTDRQINDFLKVSVVTLIVYLMVILLPQVIASRFGFIDGWVNLVGRLFEQRWPGRNFYASGSYVTTLRRVNGLAPEAGYLAAQLGIVFIPPLLAALKNRYDYFSSAGQPMRKYWYLLVATLITLLFAKTSTGIVVIALTLILLFIAGTKSQRKRYLGGYAVLGIIGLIGYLLIPSLRNLLDQYIFQKSGTSNRIGGTLGLLATFIHYPFTGVGNSFTNYFLLQFVPQNTRYNAEYFAVYSATGYPVLSNAAGWLAQYGLIIIVPVIFYLYRKIKAAFLIKRQIRSLNDAQSRLYKTVIDSFFYSLIMYFVLSVLIFTWSENYYFMMFFFYVVVINQLQKRYLLDR